MQCARCAAIEAALEKEGITNCEVGYYEGVIVELMKNDFKSWRELGVIPENEPLKSLFVRLGYSKEDIANMLKDL